ncbi:MAG TPA: hypothetical protein VK588_12070, partial [Chitinophagaceae bacterium]|nr:hypothetical protein [Chitinophagaceae bacterium]
MKTHYPFLFGFIAIILYTSPSYGQTSWRGTTSTAWSVVTNWTAGVPTSTKDAIIGDANFTGVNQP